MDFQALHDRVVVKKTEDKNVSAAGIIIAADTKEKTTTGEIVAIGNGKILDNGAVIQMTVQVGEVALFNKGTGVEVKIDGVEYIILHEYEILGDRKSTRLNSSHIPLSRMPSSA